MFALHLPNKLKNLSKKQAITISILFVVIIIFLMIIILSRSSSVYQEDVSPNTYDTPEDRKQDKAALTGEPASTNTPIFASWINHKSTTFSIQHPPDWVLEKGNVTNGGEVVIIKPNGLSPEIHYPKLIVQTEPLDENRVEQKVEIITSLGLSESDIRILNRPAKKFSGTIPFKKQGGKIINEPVQETSIHLINKDMLYVIQFSYEGSVVNNDLEKYFYEIIEGITLL